MDAAAAAAADEQALEEVEAPAAAPEHVAVPSELPLHTVEYRARDDRRHGNLDPLRLWSELIAVYSGESPVVVGQAGV